MMDSKISELLGEKFHSILRQSESSLDLFGPIPPIWHGGRRTQSIISSASVPREDRKKIMAQWGSYIRRSGMTRVSVPRNAAENAYVLDPATSWFNAGVHGVATSVPKFVWQP